MSSTANPLNGAPDPAAAPAGTPAADATADLRQEIADLREQVAEGQRTAQYWAEKARQPAAPAPAAAPEEEPDVLEAITTGGAKGFDALAKQRGFIQRAEVEGLINEKASAFTKEQELMDRYPDLKKRNSDFFKATAVQYGELVKSGTPQAIAMELAAERAELNFMRTGKVKPPGDTTKQDKETERLARIAAQGAGDTSGRPAAGGQEDEDLTAEQKHIADAMGVSHEAYAKRAKAGVAMKGIR